jgi:hypothetical protein
MKLKINLSKRWLTLPVSVVSMLIFHANVYAQDSTAVTAKESTPTEEVTAPVKAKTKPVKHSFQSIWIIDNQTVMVPVKDFLLLLTSALVLPMRRSIN